MEKQQVSKWKQATGDLKWGQQRAFLTALNLVAEGKTTMTYNADYGKGGPCLVNTIDNLVSGNASSSPSLDFPNLVSAFDNLNSHLGDIGVNPDKGIVSPVAAEIMVRHFGTLKDAPEDKPTDVKFSEPTYVEPSDLQFAGWLEGMKDNPESVKDIVDVPTGERSSSISDAATSDSGLSL